jgi:Right handed beta helix region
MQRLVWFSLVFALTLASASQSLAETFIVHPDGSSFYPTIQSAINAAVDGDRIELASGTFTGDGNRDLNFLGKAITVASQDGYPSGCIINCDGSIENPHRAILCINEEPANTRVVGIKIIAGYSDQAGGGSAIVLYGNSSLAIENCIIEGCYGVALHCNYNCVTDISGTTFINNRGDWGGTIGAGRTDITITDCLFIKNHMGEHGGLLDCIECSVTITNSIFKSNTAVGNCGITLHDGSIFDISNCLFLDNETQYGTSALTAFAGSEGDLTNCTFINNTDELGVGVIFNEKISTTRISSCTFWNNATANAVLACGHQQVTVTNTIIAGTRGGGAVDSGIYVPTLSCTDIWGNEGGDWVDEIADQYGVDGNISADPLFCDPDLDLTLDLASPCAPFSDPNPGCDLIGAWPSACGESAVGKASWGGIKNLYR